MDAPKNGKKVLIIDDDSIARGICRGLLESEGFEVAEAEDGKTGLALFEKERFDCVILDIYMPGLTGLDVIQQMDPDRSKVPIIVLSGESARSGARPLQLAASLGAARSFVKDFEHEDLLKAVRELTGL